MFKKYLIGIFIILYCFAFNINIGLAYEVDCYTIDKSSLPYGYTGHMYDQLEQYLEYGEVICNNKPYEGNYEDAYDMKKPYIKNKNKEKLSKNKKIKVLEPKKAKKELSVEKEPNNIKSKLDSEKIKQPSENNKIIVNDTHYIYEEEKSPYFTLLDIILIAFTIFFCTILGLIINKKLFKG